MRCLTLARALRDRGDRCVFASRPAVDGAFNGIAEAGFGAVVVCGTLGDAVSEAASTVGAVQELGMPSPDWLVVDHYDLDEAFEREMRGHVSHIAVIDDLADRPHDCDLLLDQNLRADGGDPYDGLVPNGCVRLLGPRFALIRPEFAAAASRPERDGEIGRILVSFGGGDTTELTATTLRALEPLARPDLAVDVVTGTDTEPPEGLTALAEGIPGITLHGRVEDMASLMASADLMVGAGGSTAWERCVLGLPSLTVVMADNQEVPTLALADAGATRCLGRAGELTEADITAGIAKWLADPDAVRRAGEAAAAVMAGSGGGAPLVAAALRCVCDPRGVCSSLRDLTAGDGAMLRRWRNSDRVRLSMSNRHVVSRAEHDAWFAATLKDPSVRHAVFECCGTPLGLVSLKELDPTTSDASWGFYIGEDWAPAGSGSRMAILALDRAFGDMGLQRVRAEVLIGNEASLRFHDRLGFRRTGAVSGTAPDGPETLEWVTFELAADDWAVARPALHQRYFEKGAA
jgi:UDP-2,4-diacetamido-2,4,6-trideoxy-beta-L-altropyranose hydrolase/UDP-4-amino-4,6-dideoxy-N-acetyl-beta-L-altrosamine N-acetyltransferase